MGISTRGCSGILALPKAELLLIQGQLKPPVMSGNEGEPFGCCELAFEGDGGARRCCDISSNANANFTSLLRELCRMRMYGNHSQRKAVCVPPFFFRRPDNPERQALTVTLQSLLCHYQAAFSISLQKP